MDVRLGHILVAQGSITKVQLHQALEIQERTGMPLGAICEQQFGLSGAVVEAAWATQYAKQAQHVDAGALAPSSDVRELVSNRRAWQFGVLPLGWDDGALRVATTPDLLLRAHRFVAGQLPGPAFFVMATRTDLESALQCWYSLPGAQLPAPPDQRQAA
ncbi:MAG: hypothetical protein MK077_01880 [Phycisphaerales bacterium]|nr:hypothetical protein [Phycisphaerales bacterium]